jgi:hypothetical protein
MINAIGSYTLQYPAVSQRVEAFKTWPKAIAAYKASVPNMAAGSQDTFTRAGTGRPHKHDFNAAHPLLRF